MKEKIKSSKGAGLFVVSVIYIMAYISGFLFGQAADSLIWKMLIFDLTATVFIWGTTD